jgi:hypothetical protein
LKYAKGVQDVEYWRDVRPIFARSCAACHTRKADKPAGNLVLDDDRPGTSKHHLFPQGAPGTYYSLAAMENPYGGASASRYVRKFQSRCSLLTWKVFGRRTDGHANDERPAAAGENHKAEVKFTGSAMPPPEAVKAGKVKPLTDEDRRTLVRWIDLGCPIDLDYDPARPDVQTGWMADRTLPALTVTAPQAGVNAGPLSHLLVGMHDAYSGLDPASFRVVADFAVDGIPAGTDLAPKFRPKSLGIWELPLNASIKELPKGKLTVSVQDRQGNRTEVARTFSVGGAGR